MNHYVRFGAIMALIVFIAALWPRSNDRSDGTISTPRQLGASIAPHRERTRDSESIQPSTPIALGSSSFAVYSDLAVAQMSSDLVYERLVQQTERRYRRNLYIIEVGALDGAQAAFAARHGYGVITVEASPVNYRRTHYRLNRLCAPRNDTRSQTRAPGISLCNRRLGVRALWLAASDHFHNVTMNVVGGAGDHIQGAGGKLALGEEKFFQGRTKTVTVRAAPIDALVRLTKPSTTVYLTKIDVQDHEPMVLRGMTKWINNVVSDLILIEFRPQGWEHMFPEVSAAAALGTICGSQKYRCYFLGLMQQGTMKASFNSSWISEVSGPSQSISLLVERIKNTKTPVAPEFGAWTDILAVADTPRGRSHFTRLLRRGCDDRAKNMSSGNVRFVDGGESVFSTCRFS